MLRSRPAVRLPFLWLALVGAACASGTVDPNAAGAPSTASTTASPGASPAAAPLPAGPPVQWAHEWARGAVFYEIFVRSFKDSNGDGIGDLPGLTSMLDYLNDGDPATTTDLGVQALWLMPIFSSPSYHGYDTIDYDTIEPDYGTNEDFARLCTEARRRGIRIILDLVINHTSDQHPWFEASASSPSSSKRNWYVWRGSDPGWTQPWGGNPSWHERNGAYYYGIFWGGMPDLNLGNPEVRREVERIARQWLDRGADGFRLDAARHLFANGPGERQNDQPETHAFWRDFSAYVRSVRPDAVLVGENWTSTARIAPYFGSTDVVKGGDELPMNFDFPLAEAILDSVNQADPSAIVSTLGDIEALYPETVIDAPFLTNHDHLRGATRLGGEPGKAKLSAALLLTMPGAPFLYYGEEVGLQNAAGRQDEAKRTPMPWDASPGGGFTTGTPWYPFAPGRETANLSAQRGVPDSLWSTYRALIAARVASPALRKGTLRVVDGTPSSVLAFVREAGGERVAVAHNLGTVEIGVDLPGEPVDTLFAAPGARVQGTKATLPARGSAIWRLK